MEKNFEHIIDILVNNAFMKKTTALKFYDDTDSVIAVVSNNGFDINKMTVETFDQSLDKKVVDIRSLANIISKIKTRKAVLHVEGKKPLDFYSE